MERGCRQNDRTLAGGQGFGSENTGFKPVKVPVTMLDGYKLLEQGERPSFDRHSFMHARQPLRFRGDWEDIGAVRDQYLPEVEALVRAQVPGAGHPDAKVLIFDHAIRTHNRVGGRPSAGLSFCCPLPL